MLKKNSRTFTRSQNCDSKALPQALSRDELSKNERKGRMSLDIIREKTQGSDSKSSGERGEPRPTAQDRTL